MKYLKIILLLLILLLSCSRYRKIKLTFRTLFSLPINVGNDSIKMLNSSGLYSEIPSAYQIRDNDLYIIDKFNNRVLQYNKKKGLVSIISNGKKNDIRLVFAGSNRILQPFHYNERLFGFNDLRSIWVSKENIYIESILMAGDEEDPICTYSFILKYKKDGTPVKIIGNRLRRSNRIYPLMNCVKFSTDKSNNLFIYLKNDEQWNVKKLNRDHRTVSRFNSDEFLLKNMKPDRKKKEKVIIENIDHSADGNFLIMAVTHFKEEIKFQKNIFYKIEIESGKTEKLFAINYENYNFILMDNTDKIYMWETGKTGKNIENIILRLYNTGGNPIKNYAIKLDRRKVHWFDIKIQKDKKITGINITDNRFNVVEWK